MQVSSAVAHPTRSLQARVWLVLAYSAVFNYPITTVEIWRRIWQLPGEQPLTKQDVAQALVELERLGCVVRWRSLWTIVGHEPDFDTRQLRVTASAVKKHQAGQVVSFLSKLPWVAGIALTGSVAVTSATDLDDTDFLVVTQAGGLWVTRLLTIVYAFLKGRRRSFAKEEPSSWCFNLWLTTPKLAVRTSRRTLYTAYEVCQAEWLFSRTQTASQFLQSNNWASVLLPHLFASRLAQTKKIESPTTSTRLGDGAMKLVSLLDSLAYAFQVWYMQRHKTNESVARGFAYFHPRDTSGDIYSQLRTFITQLQLLARKRSYTRPTLVTGVFDILHQEHRKLLRAAKALGRPLIVGIESDVRVRRLKGQGRPVNSQDVRRAQLLKLELADEVFVLPEEFDTAEDHLALLQTYQPAILAVSSHTPHRAEKSRLMSVIGGRVVVVLEHNPSVSTTQLLQADSTQ